MKNQKTIIILVVIIGVLSLFAALMGLFNTTAGQSFEFTNQRGETTMINGQGLYFFDTVSSAAQAQANDLVTLLVGLPLLIVSAWLAARGSLRGRLLLAGTIGFFLYTYLSLATLAAYNQLFLVYTAIFACSLYAFILCLMSFDLDTLPARFTAKFPHGWVAGLLFVVAGFVTMAWMGRILPTLLQNKEPVLENATTMIIQFMDLSLVVPAAVLGGILLLQRKAWGYLLSSVMLTKGVTLGLGVSAMAINMSLKGFPESMGIMVPFLAITIANLVMTVILLKNVKS